MAPIHSRSSNLPTQSDSVAAPRDTTQPPSYQDAIATHNNPSLPSVQLPRVIRAYNKWGLEGFTTFHYCGESEKERLYTVKVQHSVSRAGSLIGARPGLFLHGGPSTSSPIIAATGDEMLWPDTYALTGPHSDLILFGSRGSATSSSVVRGRITNNALFALTFQVQISRSNEVFSWINIPDGSEPGFKRGGFKLVRHPARQGRINRDPLFRGRFWPAHDICNEDEILAILSCGRHWQIKSEVHRFTIEFTSEAVSRNIGDAAARSILVTAARCHQMKANGMASPTGLEAAERRRDWYIYGFLNSNPARIPWTTLSTARGR
ncbi:hypothetical protein GGR51DRAFT_577432 [Nemania sp. FL0031]|nr:hypothetical protein GGR51DRAFT_577432 [Nemania sp. FL0031]